MEACSFAAFRLPTCRVAIFLLALDALNSAEDAAGSDFPLRLHFPFESYATARWEELRWLQHAASFRGRALPSIHHQRQRRHPGCNASIRVAALLCRAAAVWTERRALSSLAWKQRPTRERGESHFFPTLLKNLAVC